MIILIAGASHTGKTVLAQKLMEKYNIPYYSIDHIKMGLIRSGYTTLTPTDDDALTIYLWPIIREIIKTALENKQSLIIEGSYIPFDWKASFSEEELKDIKDYFLIMSESYIKNNFVKIKDLASVVESRIDDSWCTQELLIEENNLNLNNCKKFGCNYVLIDTDYSFEIDL